MDNQDDSNQNNFGNLPEWIKKSGWLRENEKSSESGNSGDAGQTDATPVDNNEEPLDFKHQPSPQTEKELPEPISEIFNEPQSVLEDQSLPQPEADLTESIPAELSEQFPDLEDSTSSELVAGLSIAELSELSESENHSEEIEGLPDWLKNYQPGESKPGDNSIPAEIPDSIVAEPSPETMEDVLDSQPQPLEPEMPELTQSSEENATSIDNSVPTTPPPFPNSFTEPLVIPLIDSLQADEIRPEVVTTLSDMDKFSKDETVSMEEIEEIPIDSSQVDIPEELITETSTVLSASEIEITESLENYSTLPPQDDEIEHFAQLEPSGKVENLGPFTSENNEIEASLSSIESDSISNQDDGKMPEPFVPIDVPKDDVAIAEIFWLVQADNYAQLSSVVENYLASGNSPVDLLARLQELSSEKQSCFDYWQLIGDLFGQSGNNEEALDAYKMAEKLLLK